MSRYIDADTLEKEISKEADTNYAIELFGVSAGLRRSQQLIRDAPTADVVEIVRCKDCKHLTCKHLTKAENGLNKSVRWCTHHGWRISDWFCADGEKNANSTEWEGQS